MGTVHQVYADSLPDLTVDSVWLEEASNPGQPVAQVAPGDQFLIVISIKNLGSATASGYYIDAYYDSDYGRGGPDTIAPGETQVWYVGPLTAVAGNHTTKWVVDPDSQIAELNEGNNEKDLTFTTGQVSITVAANPSGSMVVDGTTYTSPQTFAWLPGSSHSLSANSPVSNSSGTQYVWVSWSDGGAQSHTITTPSSSTTYTANYQTQFQVTYSQTGCSLPVSLPSAEWVTANGSAVGSFPTTVSSSDGETQCLLQSSSSAGPVKASTVRSATYKVQYYLTVVSSYGNSTIKGLYDAGSTATFTVTSPVSGGAGTQYLFTGWSSSDAGGYSGMDKSHSVTMNGPITETASWKTQWQVTFAVNPSAGGAITVNGQPAATAWYNDSATLSIQANSNNGYAFSSWSNGGAASITFTNSSSRSTTATIHGSDAIMANFDTADTTPPVITPTIAPKANSNGWNNGSVTVTWSVSDPESGIVSSNGCTATTLGTETPLAGTTLTCSAINGAGLTNSASVTVKIDVTAPALTLPSHLTVEATGSSGASVSYSASTSDSLSGLNTLSCTPPSGSTFPLGTTTVSCSANDKAGNTASGTFAVTVQDKTPPVVTVPADMTVEATGASGAVVTFSASASDLVDGSVSVTCTPASGSTFPLGTTKVTCSATDRAGNSDSASFNVVVQQKTPPVVAVPSDMTVEATSKDGAVVTFTASASDVVDGSLTPTCTPSSGSTFALGSTKVACSATDKAGNTGSASFNVLVQDKTPPVVTVPADITANATSKNGAAVTFTASASDLVDGSVSVTCTPASGSTFPLGTTKVTCSATDKAGNAASAFFNVIVQSKISPVVTVPADMIVNATSKDGAAVTFSASATDLLDGSLTPTCTPASGSTFAIGSTKVTCSATDQAGNTGSASFNVNVVDKTPPTLTLPSDMTVQATSSSGAVVTFSASASDLVDGSVPITCTPASGSTFPAGTTSVSCSAKDKAGNSASGSFRVTVQAVTVKLIASNGKGLSGAVVEYYSGGWKPFGTTGSDGTVSMALPPGPYIFQITYAGASEQKSQNVATDPNVVFQTVQVHSDSGKCTSYIQVATVPTRYHGGGWQTFTQDMELLPGTYMFRFGDGTANTSYTLVVGAVKHIH
jgi:hypothetical protein